MRRTAARRARVPADQAAGLRRRRAEQPLRCIHSFFDSAQSTLRLTQQLHQSGQIPLLVDMRGRLFADSSPRSLLDWKQQLERGQLHTLPLAYGDGWYAPGVRADEPVLRSAAQGYDYVVFDEGSGGAGLALMPGALHGVIIEVRRTHESMLHAYALLKTLFQTGDGSSVEMLGDTASCEHVREACGHFLGPRFAQAICCVVHEDDVIAALIVKMAAEETSLATRYKQE